METQFISRLPILAMSEGDRQPIGDLAMRITGHARTPYALNQKARHRIHTDLGTPDRPLNQKLTAWWNLDFPTFRAELQKLFKRCQTRRGFETAR
jgi:hypothetical protein